MIRALISFSFLFVLTRVIGKKQLAQFTYFDYIVGITVGNFAANMVLEPEINIIDGLVAVTVWTVLPVFLSLLSRKHKLFLRLFESSPTIIIENGQFRGAGLIKENLSVQNVMMLLRKKGYSRLEDIELAVFETSGDLSVFPIKESAVVTLSDIKPDAGGGLKPQFLIVEGHVLEQNLKELNISKEWLEEQARQKGANKLSQVLVAQLQDDGTLYIDVWNGNIKNAL